MANDKLMSIRLPQDFVDRAEALVESLQQDPTYRYVSRLGTSFVLRLAIEHGLDQLEAEREDKDAD